MKYEKTELLRHLCLAFGPSGCEEEVAELIKEQILGVCDKCYTDRLGNVIAVIAPEKSDKKLMISAHMDEVGFMVNEITDDGYLKFDTLGGIDNSVLCGKFVTLLADNGDKLRGVITSKAIHHKKREERLDVTPITSIYIDIGLSDKEAVLKHLDIGTWGTFDSEFVEFGKNARKLKCKAIDDRLGCAAMIEVMRAVYPIKDTLPAKLYFCFTVREEIGISGAQVAAQTIAPDAAIVLETTAVADIEGTPDGAKVAIQGAGGAISLMDRSTIYDRALIERALDIAAAKGIKAQIKKYVSGGNDSAHIHKSGVGVRTLALSAPTRYLHSPACVADREDFHSMISMLNALVTDKSFLN